MQKPVHPGKRVAMITASYAPDLDRCRLLCETADRYVSGVDHHYLLVASHDIAAFRSLEGPHRTVVDERDLLPGWLRSFDDPLSRGRKRIWLSTRTWPLRGWHVQQMRRIAIAAQVGEDALLYCDSDVAFLRPYDASTLWRGEDLRLFRRDDALMAGELADQAQWSCNAGRLLGLPGQGRHDYIGTVIAWRRTAVEAMMRRIEATTGRHWVAAMGASRKFSECMIYGRFADEVLAGSGHFHDDLELCKVHWSGSAMSGAMLRDFVDELAPGQVAIGMQSFIGTDIGLIRELLARA